MTDIIVAPQTQFIAPVTDINTALLAYQHMKDFVSSVLRKDIDFGIVPGASKPTLYKPGAEKLSRFFGLFVRLSEIERIEDWTGVDHNSEPFFFYRYKAMAMRGETVIAEGIGSCSSWEKKYRYRQSERVCPKCGKPAIITGKAEYGGGYICYLKKGGCGAKFKDNDESISGQQVGQITNPDPADQVNTIDKMAQKRAIIAAILLACNASEYFTQDIEDYIDSSYVENYPTQPVQPTQEHDYPPEPATTEALKPNGKKQRPFDPFTLRDMLIKKSAQFEGMGADQNIRNMVAANLEICFAGNNATAYRKTFTSFIFGESSTKTLSAPQILALKAWMNVQQDSGGAWVPDALAVSEANTALTEALKMENYVDMPFTAIEPIRPDQQSAPVVPPIQEQDLSTMSLETARSVISSGGRTYGEIEDADPRKIDVMPIGINKGLKKAGLTSEQYDEYMFKLSAIHTIQSARPK